MIKIRYFNPSFILANPFTVFLYVSISSNPGDQATLKHVILIGKIKHPLIKKFLNIHKKKNKITKKLSFDTITLFKHFL